MLSARVLTELPLQLELRQRRIRVLSFARRFAQWVGIWGAAGACTALGFLVADTCFRDVWRPFSWLSHLAAGGGVYVALGTAGACLLGLGALPAALMVRVRPLHYHPRAAIAVWFGAAAAWAASDTAGWTFSGAKISRTAAAVWGPWAFVATLGVAGALAAYGAQRALGGLKEGRLQRPVLAAGLLIAVAAALVYVDLTVFVALYSRLHTLLEVSAAALGCTGFAILWRAAALGSASWRRVLSLAALLQLAWCSVVLGSPAVRQWIHDSLAHVWLEEVYLGRQLRRLGWAEAYLRHGGDHERLGIERLDLLRERFDLTSSARSPAWDQPTQYSARVLGQLQALRGTRRDYSLAVFYVDTLRDDITRDRRLMPNLRRFRDRAWDFQRGYSCGSDTLRALPGLTSGSYDFVDPKGNDLLDIARAESMRDGLAISTSAYRFLHKLRPEFRFTETLQVQDFDPSEKVWGYGADRLTAAELVDNGLDWLAEHSRERFFHWQFHFDQHAWREIDEASLTSVARGYGLPTTDEPPGRWPWRYQAIARQIDEEFGRFLDGLERLGLSESTIVLFVADHGEALGRDDFWVHSVFLWEGLVRVPLALRVPGLAPRRITTPVSLVDVTPTLARYLQREPQLSGYHGRDLLLEGVAEPPLRRQPLLMAATSKRELVRIGAVAPDGTSKLVLPFESGTPELYDLTVTGDPDRVSAAEARPSETLRLLSELVRSPLFPRRPSDFQAYIE